MVFHIVQLLLCISNLVSYLVLCILHLLLGLVVLLVHIVVRVLHLVFDLVYLVHGKEPLDVVAYGIVSSKLISNVIYSSKAMGVEEVICLSFEVVYLV